MNRNLIFILTTPLILQACSQKEPDKLCLYLETQNQEYCNDLSNAGWETKYIFMEHANDKSVPEAQAKSQLILNYLNQIDSISIVVIKSIQNLKLELLKDIGQDEKTLFESPIESDDLHIPVYDLLSINSSAKSKLLVTNSNRIDLRNLINTYRNELSKIIVRSNHHDTEENNFYFDPPVANVKTIKELDQLLEKSFKENRVSPDDKGIVKKIFGELTLSQSTIEFLRQEHDWLTVFGMLTQIQTKILRARADAFMVLGSRMCIADYSFNKIIPLAYGPEIIQAGKSAEIQVFMAAFNSDKQPIVKTNSGNITSVKDGKAYLTVQNLKPGKHTLRGTITTINKYGIPKILPWEKEILVIE